MGHYGTGTTCGLCFGNHATRSDAVACADNHWKRAGYAGFIDATDPAHVITEDGEVITHEPTPPITADEVLDYVDLSLDTVSAMAREVIRLADPWAGVPL